MITYQNALEKIRLYLDREVLDANENNRLVDKLNELPVEAVQFIGVVLDTGDDKNPESSPQHLSRSLDNLIEIVTDVPPRRFEPLLREEFPQVIPTIETLNDEMVKKRLVSTTFVLFRSYETDQATALVDHFNLLTQDSLFFVELPLDDAVFYRKLCLIALTKYSDLMPKSRMEYFLLSQLFLLSLLMDIEVIPALARAIQSSKVLSERRNFSLDLATALSFNGTLLGQDQNGQEVSIKEWVAKAEAALDQNTDEAAFNLWLANNKDIHSNNEYISSLIQKTLLVYYALLSGYFLIEQGGYQDFQERIQEEEKDYQERVNKEIKNEADFSALLLEKKVSSPAWLLETASLQSLLRYLAGFPDKAEALRSFRILLSEGYPNLGMDMDVVTAFGDLQLFLKKNGYDDGEDMMYFDEQKQTFVWS